MFCSKLCLSVLIALSFLAYGHAQQLDLIASESFDYSAGTLNGQNGGTGWASAWSWTYGSGGSLAVSATGLTYPNLTTSGGSATWASGGNNISQATRFISLQNTGVVYFQFLSELANSGGGTPNIRFSANSTLTGGIGGNGGTYASYMSILDANLAPAGNGSSSSTALLSDLTLSILRIDFNANSSSLWTNPNLASFDYLNPTAPNATFAGLAPAFDQISIYTRSPGTFDEIKVFSVVPEPRYGLAVAAIFIIMALRRFKPKKCFF